MVAMAVVMIVTVLMISSNCSILVQAMVTMHVGRNGDGDTVYSCSSIAVMAIEVL